MFKKPKSFSFTFFEINGRCGRAEVSDAIPEIYCTDDKRMKSNIYFPLACSALADVERLFLTSSREGASAKFSLSCLLSVENILDSSIRIVNCPHGAAWHDFPSVSVRDLVSEYLDSMASSTLEEMPAYVDKMRDYISTYPSLIAKYRIAAANEVKSTLEAQNMSEVTDAV